MPDHLFNIIIKNSHISENFAYANSGIHFERGTLLLQNTLISENRNFGSGDAYADGSISISETQNNLEASALIVNCTFATNQVCFRANKSQKTSGNEVFRKQHFFTEAYSPLGAQQTSQTVRVRHPNELV